MSLQVLDQGKARTANFTLMCLLLGMRKQVILEVLGFRCMVITTFMWTSDRVTRMDETVGFQLTPVSRRISTDVAEVFLFVFVCYHVVFQGVLPLKPNTADLADIGFLIRVFWQMQHQLSS